MALDDIGLLRLFVAAVDAGSLSSAARALNITLPMASRRLRQLEAHYGVRLLQRTTRRQSLTSEGELLYRSAVQTLAGLEQVEQQLTRKREAVSGVLRLTAPVSLGQNRITPLLADFRALHPELRVQLDLSDTVLDLVETGMDMAIRFGGLDDSSYVSRPLAPNRRVLCAAPDYLRRHGEPRHPAELIQHQCLHIGRQLQADWRFDGAEPITVRILAHMAANDGQAVHRWALDGHGIARKSIWDVAEDLASGKLRRLLSDYAVSAAPLHVVYPHRQHVAPRVRAFIDYLATHLHYPEFDQTAPEA